jgi:glycerol-3-phosphate dehydrogenase (NAD(P)+)
MRQVAIIGAGNIGRALGSVLALGIKAEFWDIVPGKVKKQKDLSEVVLGAEAVFICVPSFAIRTAAAALGKSLSPRVPVVGVAKGIDAASGKTMDALFAAVFPKNPVVLLFGPMLAAEILEGRGGAAVAASKSLAAARKIAGLFDGMPLHVRTSRDITGVALAGALKNIYAILLGAADGVRCGWNAKGFLAGESLNEMAALLEILGGERETAHSPAGFGDLLATGLSSASRNHEVGRVLGGGGKGPKESEGTRSLPLILRHLGAHSKKFPLLLLVAVLIKNPTAGRKDLKKFLKGD